MKIVIRKNATQNEVQVGPHTYQLSGADKQHVAVIRKHVIKEWQRS
ncbi:hypothetical protein [Hypericibacter sp.]